MKWIAIAGSWKNSAPGLETDVRSRAGEIARRKDGIVTGGALGVDFLATDEYLTVDPTADRIKIFLPCTLERYAAHYRRRAEEGVIVRDQAEALIQQLERVRAANPDAITEHPGNTVVDKAAYFERISKIIDASDMLIAFQVNQSEGTQDTIDKARRKGIPVEVISYTASDMIR